MTAVLVHGSPETGAIWKPLLGVLAREDVVVLSPPGFGAPVPPGFSATTDDYLTWLVEELEGIGEPVDVVGHDWGGGHVVRLAIERPDLLRSWVTDIGGCFAPDYAWHSFAQAWQTPGTGEEAIAALVAAPRTDLCAAFEGRGMPHAVAEEVVAGIDEAMGRCILSLYRSAAQPVMAQIGERLGAAAATPGLAVIPTEDEEAGGEHRARWAAAEAHAEVTVLPHRGHWWMVEAPEEAANFLRTFWSSID